MKADWLRISGSGEKHRDGLSGFPFCLMCPRLDAREASNLELSTGADGKEKSPNKSPLSSQRIWREAACQADCLGNTWSPVANAMENTAILLSQMPAHMCQMEPQPHPCKPERRHRVTFWGRLVKAKEQGRQEAGKKQLSKWPQRVGQCHDYQPDCSSNPVKTSR